MATLHGRPGRVEMNLRPYRVTECGLPTWILTQLEMRYENDVLLSATITVTDTDLTEIGAVLSEIAGGRRDEALIASTDEDFVVAAQRSSAPGDLYVGFWTGEPYAVMRGYRFPVAVAEVEQFVRDLQSEAISLLRRA